MFGLRSLFGSDDPPPKPSGGRKPLSKATGPTNGARPVARNGNSDPQAKPKLRSIEGGASRATPDNESRPKHEIQEITSVADIPQFRAVVTATGEDGALPPGQQVVCAGVLTGSGHVWLVVERQYFETAGVAVSDIRARLRRNKLVVERTVISNRDLIAAIYESAPRLKDADRGYDADSEEARDFHEFISYGFNNRATDVHFEVRAHQGIVRYRIDGKLRPMRNPTKGVFLREQLIGAVGIAYNKFMSDKTGSHSNFNEEESQACMIPYTIGKTELNLRFQSTRLHTGFDVIIRYLPPATARTFESLGYSEDQIHNLKLAARSARRMFLICGITGSGKSTTLTTAISSIPRKDEKKIFSVEDPVEYADDTISKISVQRTLKANSEKAPYREIEAVLMRCDPDVVNMGEIRDRDTGAAAQTFIRTGHQVMATLHANSVIGAFDRLTGSDIGMSLESVTSPKLWSLIVYQALVPVLCVHCRLPAREVIPELMTFIENIFRISTDGMFVQNDKGCEHCDHVGTTGATVVAEMMTPTREVLQAMRQGDQFKAERLWRATSDGRFDSPNMEGKTVFEHALYKAYLGIIDPREVEEFEAYERFEILDSRQIIGGGSDYES